MARGMTTIFDVDAAHTAPVKLPRREHAPRRKCYA
jgi:hypothetical protein